ncbi:hypothetical protein [Gloeocapsa sp. PCC 73106]|uniref:hypothetical protein n=1 Tax=Gloeocapsa sp. PCC 73106 TaxID=102232 RepID=UPI0002ACA33E|nr:hypothetical protein [Gloeocapsa sp. PCC 73106]ELR96779.1 hypothetical protein GLO73106DRAFT_00005780 [Gloeocapsa sp. PCC 73106]
MQYNETELKTIANAPMMAGMAISLVDLGIVSTAIEAAALGKEFVGVAKKYPNNSLIQTVFSEENFKSGVIKPEKPEITPEEVQSGALVDRAIASISEAITILTDRATPEEIQEYKQFIYGCGEAVAEAAGSGLFGSGSPKVSEKEALALSRLKTALAI